MKRAIAVLSLALVAASLSACRSDTPHLAAPPVTSTTTEVAPPTTTTSTTAPPPPPPRTFGNTTSGDAAAVAGDVAAAEAATVDPNTTPEEVHNAGVALELGYRKLAYADPSVETAVLAALPDEATRDVLADNVDALRHLIVLGGNAPATHAAPPADWTIVEPRSADELLADYQQASAATGVPWQILAGIHFVETHFGRVHGSSSAGAQGPMQFLPRTWAAYSNGGDINSDHDAIFTAARYLLANGAPARLDDAIFHYNHSSDYVAAVKDYANRLIADQNSIRGYREWQILYRTTGGVLMLPTGWPAVAAVPIAR